MLTDAIVAAQVPKVTVLLADGVSPAPMFNQMPIPS